MSKNENVAEQTEEKKMTKYDLKKQKRQEAKAREKKEKKVEMIVSVVVIAALVCLIASFPIRANKAVRQTIVSVNGYDISRVEFDYTYNAVKNNYLNQFGSVLSYIGLDPSKDLSTQMYSDTLTWRDYFEQQTVEGIIRNKALKDAAEAAGFTYNSDEEFTEFKQNVEDAATEAGGSSKEYLKAVYGVYATFGRLEEYVREDAYVNAYFAQVSEEKAPSEEAIMAEYEANKQNYDSVDFYQTVIKAEMPTEPTELADPVEEDAEATEETTYVPSEAEIAKAMEDAKVAAEEAVKTVETEENLRKGSKYASLLSKIGDWLYDESRQEGDTTVIEDATGQQYYVLSFAARYLDDTPSADMRIIAQEGADAQAILDEWKSGDATEESFGVLANKYNEGSSFNTEGGFYEAVTPDGTAEELATWLFDENRAAGDTTVIATEDGHSYVMYYVEQNLPTWKIAAKRTVLSETMQTYLEELCAGYEVSDPDNNMRYLQLQTAVAPETEATTEETVSAETEVAETETVAE